MIKLNKSVILCSFYLCLFGALDLRNTYLFEIHFIHDLKKVTEMINKTVSLIQSEILFSDI